MNVRSLGATKVDDSVLRHSKATQNVRHPHQLREERVAEKAYTSERPDALPVEQCSSVLLADALYLVARVAKYQRSEKYDDRHFHERYLSRIRVPVAFARRSPLINDPSWLAHDQLCTMDFESDMLSAMAVPSGPENVSRYIPRDLAASAYEVRYLSLVDLAGFCVTPLTRFYERHDDKEKEFDLSFFEFAASDAASVTTSDRILKWFHKAVETFNTIVDSHALAPVATPHDNREPVVLAASAPFVDVPEHQRPYADDRVRAFYVTVDGSQASDISWEQVYEATSSRERHYLVPLQFQTCYLPMQTRERFGEMFVVPANLFASAYNTATNDARFRKPQDARREMARLLSVALTKFGAPVRTRDDLLKLFGNASAIKRFCQQSIQLRDACSMQSDNFRAVCATMLRAAHALMDTAEREWRVDAKACDRVLSYKLRCWADLMSMYSLYANRQLLAFQADKLSSEYNNWRYDNHRDKLHDECNNGAYGRTMYEPYHMADLFYGTYMRPLLQRDCWSSLFDDIQPDDALQQQFRECLRKHAPNAKVQADFHVAKPDGILMFAFEPTSSYDPSSANTYARLYDPTKRVTKNNPNYVFCNNLLGYLQREIHNEHTSERPDVKCYADNHLVIALARRVNDPSVLSPSTISFNQACEQWHILRCAAGLLDVAAGRMLNYTQMSAPFYSYHHLKEEQPPF